MQDVEFLALTGSPGELSDLSATAARAAGALTETRTGLARVERDLEGHVSGAVDTARQLLADLRAEVDLCAEVLGRASRALAGRSGSLAGEQQDAHRAILARDEALVRVDRAADDEATALRIAADPFDPRQPDWASLSWLARMRGGEARADVMAAESRWRQARDAKQAGSRQTASHLTGLAHVRAVRLASAAGTGLTAYTGSWQSGLDLAGLVLGAGPDMPSETRAAARDELLAAIRAAGSDPVLWTAFWETTTPAELYTAIGVTSVDDDVTVALTDGLAAWARSATPSEQEALGRALVEELPASYVEIGDRAELAAALLAPSLPSAVHVGAADALVGRRQQQSDDADLVATGSLTVAIADGLAAHPPAALEHLAPSDEEVSLARTHAWFGTTPPDGWPDGGTAVTGLLAAAVGAGTGTDDVCRQRRTALLASAATKELVTPGNGLLGGPYPVSDAASRNVADAYAPYLVSAGDAVQWQQHGRPRPEPGLLGTPQLAEGTGEYAEIVQPHLDAFAFRDVIAATSGTEASSGYWLQRVDTYLDDAVTGVTAEGRSSGDAEALAEGATRDAAAVLGAVESESIMVARAEDDATAATAAWFSSGLSVAATRSPAGTSLAATGVGALLPPFLPDGVGPAREEVLTTEPGLRERTTGRFQQAVGDMLAAQGYSAEEVERATERLDPHSDNMKDVFGSTFAVNADLRRELGELT
ncbi:hypothetical protein [Isoptericola croceus]|uniref:hypothetical protein n=1 Tax=Isoptericola croceus TaxID=3031406 RepID=UPI0023F6F9C9|nr:hypothetical protein [Isoptericola croceus]